MGKMCITGNYIIDTHHYSLLGLNFSQFCTKQFKIGSEKTSPIKLAAASYHHHRRKYSGDMLYRVWL